ncbi:MAG: hypothetical protein WB711_01665 [Terriglobales bacterium]
MSVAAILGLCFLLPWLAPITPSVSVIGEGQATASQQNQTSKSPAQGSSAESATDQRKAPDQSAKSAQPSSSTPPCPDNSQPASDKKSDCKATKSNQAKAKKHHAYKAVAPAAPPVSAGPTPTKTVVRNGGAADPTVDLVPAPSPKEASRLETYNQLLAATETDLQKISGRELSTSQQDTVKQVKSYMEQARDAAKDGDLQRAYNLAVKANLLSASLAGQ